MITSVVAPQAEPAAEVFQSYPNPFNHNTIISYELPIAAYVTITVFNLKGQLVKRLVNNRFQFAGPHTVKWNAAGFATGAYICNIKADDFSATIKMLLSR